MSRKIIDYFMTHSFGDIIYERPHSRTCQNTHILVGITQGLEFLHQNKILHRDFKPENVLFTYSQASKYELPVKIGDFGISRRMGSPETATSSRLTSGVGTDDYRAPELKSNDYNYPSDIFSLGLVIW